MSRTEKWVLCVRGKIWLDARNLIFWQKYTRIFKVLKQVYSGGINYAILAIMYIIIGLFRAPNSCSFLRSVLSCSSIITSLFGHGFT